MPHPACPCQQACITYCTNRHSLQCLFSSRQSHNDAHFTTHTTCMHFSTHTNPHHCSGLKQQILPEHAICTVRSPKMPPSNIPYTKLAAPSALLHRPQTRRHGLLVQIALFGCYPAEETMDTDDSSKTNTSQISTSTNQPEAMLCT